MPLRHVRRRVLRRIGLKPTERGGSSKTAAGLGNGVLPPEIRQQIVSNLDPSGLSNFRQVNWQAYRDVAAVKSAGRQAADREAEETNRRIYDELMQGWGIAKGISDMPVAIEIEGEAGVQPVESPLASAAYYVRRACKLAESLDIGRQEDLLRKIESADPVIRSECLADVTLHLWKFERNITYGFTESSIALLQSDDPTVRFRAASLLVAAETWDLLSREQNERIEAICDSNEPARGQMAQARRLAEFGEASHMLVKAGKESNERRRLQQLSLARLMNEARLDGERGLRRRNERDAAPLPRSDESADEQASGKRPSSNAAAGGRTDKMTGKIYDEMMGRRGVGWRFREKHIPGCSLEQQRLPSSRGEKPVSASEYAAEAGHLATGLDLDRQNDLADRLDNADPTVRVECLRALAPHVHGFETSVRNRLVESSIALLKTNIRYAHSCAAFLLAAARFRGLLLPRQERRIDAICNRSGSARESMASADRSFGHDRSAAEVLKEAVELRQKYPPGDERATRAYEGNWLKKLSLAQRRAKEERHDSVAALRRGEGKQSARPDARADRQASAVSL